MALGWKGLTFIMIIVAICYKVIEKPAIPEQINEYDASYKGFDIKSPLLYGTPLMIFKYILKLPIIGTFLCGAIYRLNGFHIVRDFGYNLDFMPIYIPRRLLTDNEYLEHLKMSEKIDSKSILNADLIDLDKILGKNVNINLNINSVLSVEEIINCYKTHKKTPIDIIKQSLIATEKLSHLNIFTQLNKDDIIKQALESTKRWKNGDVLSILDGIPIAIKDEYDVIGYNTTYGTSFMDKLYGESQVDDISVARIRRLGAIIFGKTNMHEIGLFPSGINSYYGSVRNPYSVKLLHDTGGSSSGSGAAVSSGIVPLALGADGGGSIRIPSSYNGIIGLKSTYGRIPFLPANSAWSVLHFGFLANTVRDQIIGYMAIAGYDKNNHIQCIEAENDCIMNPLQSLTNPPVHLYHVNKINDLSDLNIGIYWEWFIDSQNEVNQQCIKIVNILINKYNAKLINITIPHLEIISKAHSIIILSEWIEGNFKYINNEYIKGRNDYKYVDSTITTMLYAQQFDIVDLLSSMKIRNWALNYFDKEIFGKKNIDIIITPTTSVTAPQYNINSLSSSISDMKTVAKSVKFAFLGNFIGIPAITVPVGYTKYDGNGVKYEDGSNFPISIQLMGNHWNEHKLFRVANLIEQKLVKRQVPPKHNRFKYEL